MEGKRSFILYADLIEVVEKLPADKAGELFLTILKYVNDQDPEPDDILVSIAFAPIKQTLKRDLKKWNTYIEKQRENGSKGGRPKSQKPDNQEDNNPTETQKSGGLFGYPKKADSVNVIVNDNVNVNANEREINTSLVSGKNLKNILFNAPDLQMLIQKNTGLSDQEIKTKIEAFAEREILGDARTERSWIKFCYQSILKSNRERPETKKINWNLV
jgi:hypothetical protein